MNIHDEEQELETVPCGYFSDRMSQLEIYQFPSGKTARHLLGTPLFVSEESAQLMLYADLLSQGFRRSGTLLYRNVCPQCKKCIPIRIDTTQFTFTKRQRQLLKRNADIDMRVTKQPEDFITAKKIQVMREYNKRHQSEAEHDAETIDDVQNMVASMNGLCNQWTGEFFEKPIYAGTQNFDYYASDILVACSMIDIAEDSVSSNYFYYDLSPENLKRSLGSFSILNEIAWCQQQKIRWYYLGYWISDCKKMSYKAQFKPHELRLPDGTWQQVARV